MKRLVGVFAACVVAFGIAVPVVLAADPMAQSGRVLMAFGGDLDVAPGQQADAVIVFDGTARISGQVNAVVVFGGDAILTGARTESVFDAGGRVSLDTTTVVLGDVRTLGATVDQAAGATVQGSVRGIESDLATLGFIIGPAFVLLAIGGALLTIVIGLLAAALGARQLREAESLIVGEPWLVLASGIIGVVALPIAAVVAIVTVVGAPMGFALAFVGLPVLLFLGWLVAAVSIGDWVLARTSPRERERPYLASIVGVVILSVLGLIPLISAIAGVFGLGAVLLLAWRTLRHETVSPRRYGMAPPLPVGA